MLDHLSQLYYSFVNFLNGYNLYLFGIRLNIWSVIDLLSVLFYVATAVVHLYRARRSSSQRLLHLALAAGSIGAVLVLALGWTLFNLLALGHFPYHLVICWIQLVWHWTPLQLTRCWIDSMQGDMGDMGGTVHRLARHFIYGHCALFVWALLSGQRGLCAFLAAVLDLVQVALIVVVLQRRARKLAAAADPTQQAAFRGKRSQLTVLLSMHLLRIAAFSTGRYGVVLWMGNVAILFTKAWLLLSMLPVATYARFADPPVSYVRLPDHAVDEDDHDSIITVVEKDLPVTTDEPSSFTEKVV